MVTFLTPVIHHGNKHVQPYHVGGSIVVYFSRKVNCSTSQVGLDSLLKNICITFPVKQIREKR